MSMFSEEEAYVGGAAAVKRTMASAKLLWTALGLVHGVFAFLAIMSPMMQPMDLGHAFNVQRYLLRGGIFTIFPLVAVLAFLLSYKIPGILLKRRPGMDPNTKILPTPYFVSTVVRCALAEMVTLMGFLLANSAKQPGFLIPFLIPGLVAWLRAYPTRADMNRYMLP